MPTLDYQTPTRRNAAIARTWFWSVFFLAGVVGIPVAVGALALHGLHPGQESFGHGWICLGTVAVLLILARAVAPTHARSLVLAAVCGLFGPSFLFVVLYLLGF